MFSAQYVNVNILKKHSVVFIEISLIWHLGFYELFLAGETVAAKECY